MFKALGALGNFARAAASLILAGLLAIGGWLGYTTYNQRDAHWKDQIAEQRAEIEQLAKRNAALSAQNEELKVRNQLLKVDDRVARINVLDQSGQGDDLTTTFEFVEYDEKGKLIGLPKQFQVQGDRIYVDYLVVKWQDEMVETGDPLRGKSIYLFHRIFGEHQKPSEGFRLDAPGEIPAPYRSGGEMSDFEKKIWRNFWDVANDPEKLQELRARSASGEAPSMKVVDGGQYKLEIRASGGISFTAEEIPPKDAT
jgi:hypothetical protein